MARVAYAMAMESPHVRADVVEVQEFPHLMRMYGIQGVPKTVINDSVEFVGAVPEDVFIQYVMEAAGLGDAGEEDG